MGYVTLYVHWPIVLFTHKEHFSMLHVPCVPSQCRWWGGGGGIDTRYGDLLPKKGILCQQCNRSIMISNSFMIKAALSRRTDMQPFKVQIPSQQYWHLNIRGDAWFPLPNKLRNFLLNVPKLSSHYESNTMGIPCFPFLEKNTTSIPLTM